MGSILCFGLLGALTGCVVHSDGPRGGNYEEPSVVLVDDDYVYYPGYEVYYSSRRHQYAYRDGNRWVSRPAPRGMSVEALRAAPSVKMNFHDSPAQHHAAVVKQYPKNWAPPQSRPIQKENRNDDAHDGRGDKNGR